MYASDDLRAYRRARKNFSLKTYGLLTLWLILALILWIVVGIIEDARGTFRKHYYICLATFALAVLIFAIFIFVEKMRFVKGLNFIVSLIIVALQIISTFALVALSWWAEIITFFMVAAILVYLFLLIGIVLPRKVDLTLDIAVLFIVAFVFLIVATFILSILLSIWRTMPYAYIVVELGITLTILLFVMYHGQTIHGNRFAEMRLNDFFLGSLILFHDFLIIFWLTFYWQIHLRPITSDSWIETSTPFHNYSNFRMADPGIMNTGWMKKTYTGNHTTQGWDERAEEWVDDGNVTPGDPDDNAQGDDSRYPETSRDRGRDERWKNSGSRGYNERDRGKHRPRPSPKEWFVYKEKTRVYDDTDDQPANEIRRPAVGNRDSMRHGVLYKPEPFEGRNFPEPEDEAGDGYNDYSKRRNKNIGADSEHGERYGDAKGKPKAGFGNPSIDFPLAHHLSKYPPASREGDFSLKDASEATAKITALNRHPGIDEALEKPYKYQLEKSEKINQETNTEIREPNLLDDEMKVLTATEQPEYGKDFSPEWEVLSQDELRKLSDPQIPKTDRINPLAEPLLTPNPPTRQQIDFEKLVMNNRSEEGIKVMS